jgi:hypothetical protein
LTGSREIVHARPERRQRACCSRVATGSRACTGVQGANIAVMPNSPLLRPWGVARGCASAGQAGRSFLRTPFMTRRRQVCMQKVQKCCNPCFFRSFTDPYRPSLQISDTLRSQDGVAPVTLRTCASIHPRTGLSANSGEQCKYAAITQQDQASVRCAPPIGHHPCYTRAPDANVHATLGTWPDSPVLSRPHPAAAVAPLAPSPSPSIRRCASPSWSS